MGADHSHGPAAPASRGAVLAVLSVVLPLALVTLAALVWMWPRGADAPAASGPAPERMTGTITKITLTPCMAEPAPDGQAPAEMRPPDPATCGDAIVELTGGSQAGHAITVALPSGPGSQVFTAGDDVVLLHTPGDEKLGAAPYQISDHDRTLPLGLLAAAFALAVIAFGRWRGVSALAGLAITFVLLLLFIIPAILEGGPPLPVAIVGAAAIMLAVLYLTHGFSVRTSVAVLGTLLSLSLTGVLASVSIGVAKLNGITDESSFNLDMSFQINTQGLLLASIIIGSLGVLDDVTVTQAVTVTELAHANPQYTVRQLYRAGARVGRAHIASVINTIILAYAGASLPLLLLISVGRQPLGDVLNTPVIVQEIVRSVVGTIGLIAAVPITTALAALTATRQTPTDPDPPPPPRHRRRPPQHPAQWPHTHEHQPS
ncbi:YibE/F family protein [Spongiactinospora sp. TRM90649]|uniref:YibE/F family protein n=1 Tax=Spongiactinospora sp. TRM90649 TaxID=3031114 RepID=UPI0023F6F56A|nr:YibE/F family protein [Spongiactinospora sp. TRM90649]MDF5751591.1 YibE/F family protein [Spongiactinospora sp. TRM90649]